MYKKPQSEQYLQSIIAASLKTPTNSAFSLIANTMDRADWSPVLAKIDKPVLFAYTTATKESAAVVKAHLPSAQLELFEDAGHALFVDDAPRFNSVVEKFVAAEPAR